MMIQNWLRRLLLLPPGRPKGEMINEAAPTSAKPNRAESQVDDDEMLDEIRQLLAGSDQRVF